MTALVTDVPASLPGSASDLWQREVLAIGPTGADPGSPDIPARDFWCVVAYDADSRSIPRNGQQQARRCDRGR